MKPVVHDCVQAGQNSANRPGVTCIKVKISQFTARVHDRHIVHPAGTSVIRTVFEQYQSVLTGFYNGAIWQNIHVFGSIN